MTPNPRLLVIIVSAGLIASLAFYLLSWGFALRQHVRGLMASWALGSATLAFSACAPWIFRISLGDRSDGFFSDATSLFLVFTTMSAFVFPFILAGAALAVSGVVYGVSKVIS